MQDISLALLILSCDKYSDLWCGYFYQFEKNFNLEVPVYFASNNLTPNTSIPLRMIQTGEELNWSSNFKKVLMEIEEKFVFITLEDLYPKSPFSIELFSEACNFISRSSSELKHLKCSGVVRGQEKADEHISRLPRGLPYRVTLCGIWNREFLLSFIKDEENPWEFEVNGSSRAADIDGFFAMTMPIYETVNMVEKGFWIRESVSWALNNDLPINVNSRHLKNWRQEAYSKIKNYYFNFIMKINYTRRKQIVDLLKKILIIH